MEGNMRKLFDGEGREGNVPIIGQRELACACGAKRFRLMQVVKVLRVETAEYVDIAPQQVGVQYQCVKCEKVVNPVEALGQPPPPAKA